MKKQFAHRNAVDGKPVDFYETHYSLTFQGVDVFGFDKDLMVLEPAAGAGAIAFALVLKGFKNIITYDLFPKEYPDGYHIEKKDFLNSDFDPVPYIITNPPNSYSTDFVMKAKEIYQKNIAFLMRLNFLSGQRRYNSTVYDELKYIYVFSRMPDMRTDSVAPIREDGKYPTAMHVYAWMIWEKGFTGEPVYRRIDNSMYVLKKKDMDIESNIIAKVL